MNQKSLDLIKNSKKLQDKKAIYKNIYILYTSNEQAEN